MTCLSRKHRTPSSLWKQSRLAQRLCAIDGGSYTKLILKSSGEMAWLAVARPLEPLAFRVTLAGPIDTINIRAMAAEFKRAIPAYQPPAPNYDWTGFYVGAYVDGHWVKSSSSAVNNAVGTPFLPTAGIHRTGAAVFSSASITCCRLAWCWELLPICHPVAPRSRRSLMPLARAQTSQQSLIAKRFAAGSATLPTMSCSMRPAVSPSPTINSSGRS